MNTQVETHPRTTGAATNWGVLPPGRFRRARAVLLISIVCVLELVLVHVFMLRSFLRPSISGMRPPVTMQIRYFDKLSFKIILLLRCLTRNQFVCQRWFKRVHQRILEQVRARPLTPEQRVQPVPTVRLDEITTSTFLRERVSAGLPVIIKGGALATRAFEVWSVEGLAQRFPDVKLKMVDLDTGEYSLAALGELLESQQTARKLYVRNTANLVHAHPELIDELGCLDFRPTADGPKILFAGAQVFVGVHRKSGTDWHCAGNINVNYQLRGRKKWYFVHPEHSWFMYPVVTDHMMFCASFVPVSGDAAVQDRYLPLYQYCPRMEAIVEPGDILLNPPWYWHAIESLDDVSVSASTRWFARGLPRANLFFDALNWRSLRAWGVKFYTLSRPPEELPLGRDENNVKLGGNNEDFTNFGRQSDKNLFDPRNWPPEHRFDAP
jgi:hypothetical protein